MADKNIAKNKEYEGYWDRFGTTPGGVTVTKWVPDKSKNKQSKK